MLACTLTYSRWYVCFGNFSHRPNCTPFNHWSRPRSSATMVCPGILQFQFSTRGTDPVHMKSFLVLVLARLRRCSFSLVSIALITFHPFLANIARNFLDTYCDKLQATSTLLCLHYCHNCAFCHFLSCFRLLNTFNSFKFLDCSHFQCILLALTAGLVSCSSSLWCLRGEPVDFRSCLLLSSLSINLGCNSILQRFSQL